MAKRVLDGAQAKPAARARVSGLEPSRSVRTMLDPPGWLTVQAIRAPSGDQWYAPPRKATGARFAPDALIRCTVAGVPAPFARMNRSSRPRGSVWIFE